MAGFRRDDVADNLFPLGDASRYGIAGAFPVQGPIEEVDVGYR